MANHGATYQPSTFGGIMQRVASLVNNLFVLRRGAVRQAAVGALLTLALVAFELFNYDTTEFALENLLGVVSFAGIRWATILAIAFCSIDFAGLARLIMPEGEHKGIGGLSPNLMLVGAWLLGGGMNAAMTWWSVTLALSGRQLGVAVVSNEQVLRAAPIAVAVLVWLTRILIISSFILASEHVAQIAADNSPQPETPRRPPVTSQRAPRTNPQPVMAAAPKARQTPAPNASSQRSRPPVPQPPTPRGAKAPLLLRSQPSGRRRNFS